MHPILIAAVRGVLVAIALGALVLQVILVPELAREATVGGLPAAPIALVAVEGVALLVCVQVVVLCTWMLLGRVHRAVIFELSALRWVDGIVVAGLIATTLVALLTAQLLLAVGMEGPGALLVLGGLLVGGVAFVLVMLVMRGLLTNAAAMRSELSAVV